MIMRIVTKPLMRALIVILAFSTDHDGRDDWRDQSAGEEEAVMGRPR